MLLVVAGDELQFVLGLSRLVICTTPNLDVRLGLLRALHCDERGAALVIVGSPLMYLVPEAIFRLKSRHRKPVYAIDLHGLGCIELSRSLHQLELGLGLQHEYYFFVCDTNRFFMCAYCYLVRAFVVVLAAADSDK